MKVLLGILFIVSAFCAPLAQYYCGFSGSFCGQSSSDDTNQNASLIILAFANIGSNGSVILDTAYYPCALVSKWQGQGKKVFLSIGGQGATWGPLFANPAAAISSLQAIMGNTTLDGIDLDIQDFGSSPQSVANFIIQFKTSLRGKYLSVCMQNVNVYQGQPIPSPSSTAGGYWNYFVPIWNLAGSYIDIVLVQAYNNWYDGLLAGSLQYLQDSYLNWRNIQSPYCTGCSVLANFTGVPGSKLLIGVPASATAGQSPPNGTAIDAFQQWLTTNNYALAGAFLWDSHWDASVNYQMSNAILTSSTTNPLTPSTPTAQSVICNATTPSSQAYIKKKLIQ